MKKRAHIRLEGDVQGVFFRWEARKNAQIFNLTGWVKNNLDSSVEIIAEGEEEDLKKLVAWCNKGPSAANVKKVISEFHEYRGEFNAFSIKY